MHSYLATSPISDANSIGLNENWDWELRFKFRMIFSSAFGKEGGTPQLIGWQQGCGEPSSGMGGKEIYRMKSVPKSGRNKFF